MFSGAFSPTHIFIVIAVAVFFFGRQKAVAWGKDLIGGLKEFKKAVAGVDEVKETVTKEITDARDTMVREATGIQNKIAG